MAEPTPNPASRAGAGPPDETAERAAKWTAALQRAGERQQRFLRQLIPSFLSECPELVGALRQAIADRDASRLKFAAHTLKSSMLFLADSVSTAELQRLETMGRTGDLTGADEAYAAMEKTLTALQPVLADFAKAVKTGDEPQHS